LAASEHGEPRSVDLGSGARSLRRNTHPLRDISLLWAKFHKAKNTDKQTRPLVFCNQLNRKRSLTSKLDLVREGKSVPTERTLL